MTFAPANDSSRLPARSPHRHTSLKGTRGFIFLAFAIALTTAAPARAQVDFGGYRPSYQGYGVNTPGARGGAVLRVTHLIDPVGDVASPFWAGSLRKALMTEGPRFIVFEVSGTINLLAPLSVSSPFVTIAGQTAPSPGILIRGGHLEIDTHDVVVQHLRIRPGAVAGQPQGIWVRTDANNVVLDHVSVSWTVWTAIGTFAPAPAIGVGDVAIIDSIVAEALACSGVNEVVPCNPATYPNSGLPNSKAFLFGDDNNNPTYNNGRQRVSMIRNLSANNNDRQPEVQGDVDLFYINNLTYNPSQTPWSGIVWADGYDQGPSMTVAKGNLLIPGPTTPGNNGYVPPFYAEEGEVTWGRVMLVNPATRIYLEGNYYARHCPANTCLASPSAQWMLVRDYVGPQGINVRAASPPLALNNLPLDSVMPYTEVEGYVLANAGARPLDRDPVDQRIVQNVRDRTGRTINTPDDVGGYPFLGENRRTLSVPQNPNQAVDGVGRTAIEAWLESMARALEPSGAPYAGDVAPPPDTGNVPVQTDPTVIPQTNWTLRFVDSQETVGEPGAATNAFDGNPSTHWHTQWYNATAFPPHEIQIDLGATYNVSGFRHLPRANGINGRIMQFEFYVSADGVTWGVPVAAGTLADVAAQQEVLFPAKTGRYIRLRALSAVQGSSWTSLAELNVLAAP